MTTTTSEEEAQHHHHLLTLDHKISQSLHTLTKPYLPISLLYLLELSADFRFFFPVTLSLLLAPRAIPLRHPFLYPFLFGLLLDLAFIGLVKTLFRRSRPHYNPDMSPAVHADHFSFPSGHASRVFFVAAFVSLYEGHVIELLRPIMGHDVFVVFCACVCVWAVATSVSRVLLGRHFLLDVVAGAFLGVLEALFVFRLFRGLKQSLDW
ncbi:PAP2 domain-containing protein [Cephalotus follicularis]|uniref:PAP2 domain-containing protein n=1 Tax=Cephalotus follicularis TaxID=3775 RepID=A0A1Q3BGZ8_CEPFO|nr:PAP2 domain-containing protein [Cephalotus follicularis]